MHVPAVSVCVVLYYTTGMFLFIYCGPFFATQLSQAGALLSPACLSLTDRRTWRTLTLLGRELEAKFSPIGLPYGCPQLNLA